MSVQNGDAIVFQKEPGRDFIILNLTDIQMDTAQATGPAGIFAKETIRELIGRVHPDLITVSGDNAWDTLSYKEFVGMMDSFRIPWAPIMGNHDGQGCESEQWCSDLLCSAKYSLYRPGPPEMGFGNYIIDIEENGRLLHTLYLMDTHSGILEDNINGKKGSGYDHLWENQFEWYRTAVSRRCAENGAVRSTVVVHIPLNEYKEAWETATGVTEWDKEHPDAPYIGEYADNSFGVRHEFGGWPKQKNGFFELMQELGSTKDVVAGHEHVNDYSIPYKGIRLTYALKLGAGCYWEPELNGGTVLRVDGGGRMHISHEFVDSAEICARRGLDLSKL